MANFADVTMNFYGKPEDIERAFSVLERDRTNRPHCPGFFDFKKSTNNDTVKFDNGNVSVIGEGSAKWAAINGCDKTGKVNEMSMTLPELCKETNVACEFYAEESGNAFQEHGMIKSDGTLAFYEARPFYPYYENESEYTGFNFDFGKRDMSDCKTQNGPEYDEWMKGYSAQFDLDSGKYSADDTYDKQGNDSSYEP